eukprot:gene12899-14228_t
MEHAMILAILMSLTAFSFAGKTILLMPFPWPSHYDSLEGIGIELQQRGHNVHVLIPSTEDYIDRIKLNKTVYDVPNQPRNTFVSLANTKLKTEAGFGVRWLLEYTSLLYTFGKALFIDKAVVELARQADLLLADTAFFAAPVFASHFKLPLVFISPYGHMPGNAGSLFGNIENPSYVHTHLSAAALQRINRFERMNFIERSLNTLAYIGLKITMLSIADHALKPLANEYTGREYLDLCRETSLVLIPMDYCLEYARPDSPSVKMIGPLTTVDNASKLPEQLQNILDKSESNGGTIIVSFGAASMLHVKYIPIFLETLLELKYKVIWRYDVASIKTMLANSSIQCTERLKSSDKNQSIRCHRSTPIQCQSITYNTTAIKKCTKAADDQMLKVGSNLYVFNWIPQQHLLQHNNTILLVTHCGTNSVYEALYHNKQVLCIPFFGDQFDNAGRVVSKNLGEALLLNDLTKDVFLTTIQDLIQDEKSKIEVKKASRRLRRTKESAAEKAAFWIEVVLDEKGNMSYLKPVGNELSTLAYFCLDIIIVWSIVLIAILAFFKTLISILVNCNC